MIEILILIGLLIAITVWDRAVQRWGIDSNDAP